MPPLEEWLGGVVPAVPVPFRDESTIDQPQLEAYATWMATQRVPAVAVGAHTGRGLHLSWAQRQTVVETWRGAGQDLLLGVGVPVETRLPTGVDALTDTVVRETVTMTEWARDEGAAAVLVYPPTPLRDLPDVEERAVLLHTAVAAVGIPTIVFHLYGAAGGIDYADRTLERMLAIEGVVGVKLATLNAPGRFRTVASLAHRGGRLCITGEDLFLGESIRMGADAALIGMAAACTDCMVDLFTYHGADRTHFDTLSAKLDRFAAVTFGDPVGGYVQRMLWALEADGILEGPVMDPFGPSLDARERERVHAAARALRHR